MRPLIVSRINTHNSFRPLYWFAHAQTWFDFEWYDADKTYAPGTVFLTGTLELADGWLQARRDEGYPVVVDNLWEQPVDIDWGYQLHNPLWFWYNESVWYHALGYQHYQPQRRFERQAFMPIRRIDHARDQIVQRLQPYLNNSVWSYKDHALPGDADPTNTEWQRYFNPDWYDATQYSIVVETTTQGQGFVTEKSFKPCAFQHPFTVIGQQNHLSLMRSWGFETFENLFDYSLDSTDDLHQKIDVIIKDIQRVSLTSYDKETQDKIQHNHARFFDITQVLSRVRSEIVNPIIEYVENSLR